MSQTLAVYAHENCANWIKDSCFLFEKIVWKDKNAPIYQAGSCRPAENKACDYFRKAVLPAAPQDIVDKYGRFDLMAPADANSVRVCPDCGELLAYRQRVCFLCQKSRRKVTYRKSRKVTGR